MVLDVTIVTLLSMVLPPCITGLFSGTKAAWEKYQNKHFLTIKLADLGTQEQQYRFLEKCQTQTSSSNQWETFSIPLMSIYLVPAQTLKKKLSAFQAAFQANSQKETGSKNAMVVYQAIHTMVHLIQGEVLSYSPETNSYQLRVKKWSAKLDESDTPNPLVKEYLEILEKFPPLKGKLPDLDTFKKLATNQFPGLIQSSNDDRQQSLICLHNYVLDCLVTQRRTKSFENLPTSYTRLKDTPKYSLKFKVNPYQQLVCKLVAELPKGQTCQDMVTWIKKEVT